MNVLTFESTIMFMRSPRISDLVQANHSSISPV